MNPKSNEFKALLSAVRERYATAKRRVDYVTSSGCNYICSELDKILEDAYNYSARGAYALAYSIAVLVLQKCGWLSSYADSSSGWLTDTVYRVQDTIRSICQSVPSDSEDAKYIFQRGLEDSQHKDFDGWDEYPYGLLRSIAVLADEKSVSKLYAVLDEFTAQLSEKNREYRWRLNYHIELDKLARYEAIKAIHGEATADIFINNNLEYDEFRKLAIQNAFEKSDLACAETLCLDRLSRETYREKPYTRPSEWDYLLDEIHERDENVEKQIETAQRILFLFDIKYFDVVKLLLTEKGVWESRYPSLRSGLKRELPHSLYMEILNKEGDVRHLIEEVRIYPHYIFTYGKYLSLHYPDEVRQICLEEIRRQTGEANTRRQYKKVCGNIEKLYEYFNLEDVLAIVMEFKKDYPHRPAFLEELDGLVVNLEKKRMKRKK